MSGMCPFIEAHWRDVRVSFGDIDTGRWAYVWSVGVKRWLRRRFVSTKLWIWLARSRWVDIMRRSSFGRERRPVDCAVDSDSCSCVYDCEEPMILGIYD